MSYKQNFTPKLVLIIGDTAIRYVDRIKDQVCKIDLSVGGKQLRADIEEFRQNGLPKEK